MAHHPYPLPKDKTNPLAYVPIAIIGVALVVWIFASGYRTGAYQGLIKPMTSRVAASAEPERVFNVRALAEDTSREMLQLGRAVYEANCSSCHGPQGLGDGSQGRGLNPPPRNFTDPNASWTNGSSILGMWKTLEEGAGGSMASYANILDPEQRMAVIHYTMQWTVDAPEFTPEMRAELPAPSANTGGGTVAEPPDPGPRIPIEDAIRKIAEDQPRASASSAGPRVSNIALADIPGHDLFMANCATCHGPGGQGTPSARVLTVFPYVRVATPPFSTDSPWISDRTAFHSLITNTLPGSTLHGFAAFNRSQLDDLHEFCVSITRQR